VAGRSFGTKRAVLGRSAAAAPGLFAFTSFTFLPVVSYYTNSSTQGLGPTLAQMQSAYAGQPWLTSYFTMGSYQGYQRWTVPATATYTIEIGGAAGGDGNGYTTDGSGYGYSTGTSISGRAFGALISGTFSLTQGHIIEMVVGIEGGRSGGPHGNENGGGGATWVYNVTTSTLLMVAGGGGGAPSITYGTSCTRNLAQAHGQATVTPGLTNGCSLYDTFTQASGGVGGYTSGSYQGGAGGGYSGVGANGGIHSSLAYGGGEYNNGLIGGAGNSCYNKYNFGGFGGGGGGMLGTPGAGGGYNGGSVAGEWSSYSDYGGGGGSYNVGSSTTATTGGNDSANSSTKAGRIGAGYCKITKL